MNITKQHIKSKEMNGVSSHAVNEGNRWYRTSAAHNKAKLRVLNAIAVISNLTSCSFCPILAK